MIKKNELQNIIIIIFFFVISSYIMINISGKLTTNILSYSENNVDKLIGDSSAYYSIAKSIITNNNFSIDGINPTTARPPIYPLFLAVIISIFGESFILPAQQLLMLIFIIFVYLIALKLKNRVTGILSVILTLFYFPIALQPFFLLSDMLFMTILVIFYYFLLLSLDKPDKKLLFCLNGLLIGLATLTRPNTLLLPFFLVLINFTKYKLPNKSLFIFLFSFLISIFPWTIRNYQVTGRIIPIASLGGFNLWQGTYYANVVYGTSEGLKRDKTFNDEFERIRQNDYYIDYQAEPRFNSEAKKRIFNNPLQYIRFCIERMLRVYTAFPGTRDFLETNLLKYLFFSIIQTSLWVIAIFGLNKINPLPRIIITVSLLYSIFFNSLFNLLARYVIYWLPFVMILTSIQITHLIDKYIFDKKPKEKEIT